MNRKEKLAAGPLLLGLLFCTSGQLICSAIGVALLGIGTIILNIPEKRKAVRKNRNGTSNKTTYIIAKKGGFVK